MSMIDLFKIKASPTELVDRLLGAEVDVEIALEIIKLIGDSKKYEELSKVRQLLADVSNHYSDEFCDELYDE